MQPAIKLEVLERRADPRLEAYKNAVIKLADKVPLSCIIDNISEGGALLVLSKRHKLPISFKLFVPDDGIEISCRRVHMNGLHVGVAFV